MGITGKSIAQTKAEQKVVVAKVERHGDKLIIPEKMKLQDAAQVIKRAMEAEEMVVTLSEVFNCFVYEGAYALKLALEEAYGWVDIQPTPSFFGDNPPELVGVTINERGDVVQVPWGRFLCPVIPKADGFLQAGVEPENPKAIGMRKFKLYGQVKQKYKEEFQKLCELVRKHLREHSIYKGKAISIRFIDPVTELPIPMPVPKFIRLDHVSKDGLVFPEDVDAAVRTNLFTPIEQTDEVRRAGIPLKRGILLAGDYGVGKTLMAFVAAKLAVDKEHTFIYCESIEEFADVMKFAQLYAESGKIAIVFCEDIDKALQGERNITMDQVLNIMDGVDSKRHEIMTIFTTNDHKKIHQAAIRPGRLDAIIHVKRPDAAAAIRLVKLYAGDRLPVTEDLTKVGQVLEGHIPAVVRECVERSKLYAIGLGVFDHLTSEAILASARTMQMQLELLEEKREVTPSDMAVFGKHVGEQIATAITAGMEGIETVPYDPADQAEQIKSVATSLREAATTKRSR